MFSKLQAIGSVWNGVGICPGALSFSERVARHQQETATTQGAPTGSLTRLLSLAHTAMNPINYMIYNILFVIAIGAYIASFMKKFRNNVISHRQPNLEVFWYEHLL